MVMSINDSGKATMDDVAFVIEKHISNGVQVPESRFGFQKQLRILPAQNPQCQTGGEVGEQCLNLLCRVSG